VSTALEYVASLMVMLGVTLMIDGLGHEVLWLYLIGVVLLTFGVRLAIDCGKAGRR
jgi:uncharacterized membrane protein YecN with MAPEG domain